MFSPDQYELLDFGEGRRLERFAQLVLDRICPAAEGIRKKTPQIWKNADAVFVAESFSENAKKNSKKKPSFGERGTWQPLTQAGHVFFSNEDNKNPANSKGWSIRHDQVTFELRGTPFGHVGVFPEQAENWDSIKSLCQSFRTKTSDAALREKMGPRVLNLFGYTGGSTLAAACAGAEVTHVDAAGNVVAWAKKNAEITQNALSQNQTCDLSSVTSAQTLVLREPFAGNAISLPLPSSFPAPLRTRWIAEDAPKFVRRELRRGNSYHGIILDPPSYGHGAHGEVWRLSTHLADLLFDCFSLLDFQFPCFLLLTCHTPDYTLNRLAKMISDAAAESILARLPESARQQVRLEQKTLMLHARSGASLPSGESLLWRYNY